MDDRSARPRVSIQRRALVLVLPLVIVFMLAIGLVSFIALNKQTAKRGERFLHDRRNEVLTIAENQSVASYFHNVAYGLTEEANLYRRELERYFRRFSDRYNSDGLIYEGIRLIDGNGNEVAKFREGDAGGEYHRVTGKPFFQDALQLASGEVATSGRGPRRINATPVYWDEDGDGTLTRSELRGVVVADFLYPLDQFRRERLVLAGMIIGFTIFAIMVTVGIVTFRIRCITGPILRLVDATRAISSGDLSTEISVESEDEVGLLAASFNRMAKDLKANIEEKDRFAAELKELNAELEAKVLERTRELETKNRELQQANVRIREADRLKSEFLANMSHELRTPMNAIIGFTRLVRRKAADLLPARQQENLEKVEISANQLLALINDVLDLSKIEAGKMSLNSMPFDLEPLVDTCLATVEGMIKRDKIRLTKSVPRNLPQVLSDADKLKQILINLLSNAVKFTEEGEVSLDVTHDGESLSIAVSDTGIGIPADALDYIFDEFRQVDGSTTRRYAGTGLGLSITRKLTHLLGGTIRVQSAEGVGSTFTVSLPFCAEDQPVPEETAASIVEVSSSGEIRERKLVLAIDDDPNVLLLLKQNLEDEGFYVLGALSPEEGIRKAKERQPFAITLDIMMPGTDGWQVLNRLKADPATRGIPIIVISIIDNRELGFSLGAFDYLVKPLDKDALIAVLKRIPRCSEQRVLVVDDEPDAVDLLVQLLTGEGYRVTGARSAQEALSALREGSFDLILLDLLMPDMDGFEMIREVRNRPEWKEIPIIVVTAKDLNASDLETLNRGADRIVQKCGFDRDSLIGEIRELLRVHEACG